MHCQKNDREEEAKREVDEYVVNTSTTMGSAMIRTCVKNHT